LFRVHVYLVHDNEVNGVSSLTYVSSTPKLLEIYNNKSETISDAIYRPTSNVPVECIIRDNSFKAVSKSTKNIRMREN
jgi:excinuclease UvrABC helicase subunit UvrB